VFKQIKHIYSFFRDDSQIHLIKSKASYFINYLKITCFSWLNRKKKIVVISLIEHIGDIIANEPVSREIRKKYPESIIIWFVRRPYKDLLIYNLNIDKVFTVFCLATWILICKKKIRFEAVYDLHFSGRACKICHLPLKKDNVDHSINGTNYFNYGGLLKAVCLHNGIELKETVPKMYIPSRVFSRSKRFFPAEKYIVIHCASNEEIKDWDDKKWDLLVYKIINDYRYPVVEIGSIRKISVKSDYYHNLCGKLSILESAVLIKKAVLFIGIDSGPAHMANALETPGVILLGEYYFGMKDYNPYSGKYGSLENCGLVYSKDLVKNIPVETVLENVHSLITKKYDLR
jgi:ADP-heptose:LPS heptosyltransferase